MYILTKIRRKRTEHDLIKGIKESARKINNSRNLTPAQENEIKQYWFDLLGIDVPLDWHRYFYKRTGVYSVKFVPTSLYYMELIGRFNEHAMNEAYTDKNIADIILPAEYQPQFILKNMGGYYYINNQAVSFHEALQACQNLEDVLIKPSLECHGNGVCKFSVKDGITSIKGKTISHLFEDYKSDFMIQKVVHQHERMSALNPTSVNTLRILTYRSGMDVLVVYAVIRIGKVGSEIDNETAGGISTKIDMEGKLSKYAYGAPGNDNVEKTDTGIVLEGYQIPSFSEALDLVKEMHLLLPHFNLVGWDIAINTEGKPVIIEFNTWPELSQSANGPAFGDYTERIIKEIWNRPNTRYF